MLTAPFVLFMSAYEARDSLWAKVLSIMLITAAAFAYSATLFPSTARHGILENSLPFLFVILISVTLLTFMQKKAD
jgi:hypothetical protein